MKAKIEKQKIHVSQLRLGIYIELKGSWNDHPFFFNKFKIKSEEQIKKIKGYGITYLSYNPDKSDVLPIDLEAKDTDITPNTEEAIEELTPQFENDNLIRKERQQQRRQQKQLYEKQYIRSAETVKKVIKTLRSRPIDAIKESTQMIDETVNSLLDSSEVIVNVVSNPKTKNNPNYHIMNVSILSLLLGKALGLEQSQLKLLGIGTMFHDMGEVRIPDKILRKKTPLNKVERNFYSLHTTYGATLASKIESFPKDAIDIIQNHHEKLDGKGYPNQIQVGKISTLARITAIVDTFDRHCNHLDTSKDLSPHMALSFMYQHQLDGLDKDIFKSFVQIMGVYPPGSIVQLSNDLYGMVISVNSKQLSYPVLVIYDKEIPQEEALIYDMRDDKSIIIKKVLRPQNIPPEISEYLNPGTHLNYTYDVAQNDK